MVERGQDDIPKSGFSRSKSKTVPQNFFPERKPDSSQFSSPPMQREDAPQREEAPTQPIPPERPADAQRAPSSRGDAEPSSSGRKAGKELKAYQVGGPVEAVGLQADAEFWHIFEDTKTLGRGHFAKVKQVNHLEVRLARLVPRSSATPPLPHHDLHECTRRYVHTSPAPSGRRARSLPPRSWIKRWPTMISRIW